MPAARSEEQKAKDRARCRVYKKNMTPEQKRLHNQNNYQKHKAEIISRVKARAEAEADKVREEQRLSSARYRARKIAEDPEAFRAAQRAAKEKWRNKNV